MREYLPDFDIEKLKKVLEIKEWVQTGKMTLEDGQKELRKHVKSIKPYEIALAEQELKTFEDDECRKEDIQGMLDLFEGLFDTSRPDLPKGHPIEHYYLENEAIRNVLKEIEDLVQYPVIKNQWYELYDRLKQFNIHLSRKQNQLYSILEQKGFDRPTTTMWTLDNFIRDEIKEARELLDQDEEKFIAMQKMISEDILDLMEKEENILYPTSLAMISPDEFEEMKEGDREIGYTLIEVDEKPMKKKKEPKEDQSLKDDLQMLLAKHGLSTNEGAMDVAMGSLTLEQINLIYRHMPVDLSYVDENEIVKFYTDTEHRIFPRSKNVIGRDVKNCHPRNSVHFVEEIIEKFRSREQDHAEFWINKPDLFIYIYYTPVFDEEGNFRGVLEMMQDCTRIRSLVGSRTLLTWGDENLSEEKEESEVVPKEEVTKEEKNVEDDEFFIQGDTRLEELLQKYPQLKNDLPKIHPAFKMLKTPLARVMIPQATIEIMSQRSGMDPEDLAEKISEKIREYENK
ncbi:MAG: PAS domain-containing protein [Tissierellia bacterium]|nr:PAS domain-containing protein [Tissierellia bacterium]